MNDLPEGWRWAPLGMVASIRGGSTPKTNDPGNWGGGIPWITPTEVVKAAGRQVFSTTRTVTPVGLAQTGGGLLPAGTVLLTTRAVIGDTAITAQPMAINQGLAGFVCAPGTLPEFLVYSLQYLKSDLLALASGTTFLEVSKADIRRLPIALPPLDEQRRIADFFAAIDAAIDAAKASDMLRRAKLAELLSDERAEAEGWERTMIKHSVRFLGGYSFPPAHQGSSSGGFPFYKVSDMNHPSNQVFMSHAANWVDYDYITRLRLKVAPVDTVVFPKVGAAVNTEKKRILGRDSVFDNNVMGIKALPPLNDKYLFYWMQMVSLADVVQPGSVPSLNQRLIGEVGLWLPPPAEQRRIVNIMDSISDTTGSLSGEAPSVVESLRSLRRSLLAEVMTGQRRVRNIDPQDVVAEAI